MGTNYYWHESGEYECPHCRRRTPRLHVGKSSAGWAFSLRVHPADGIHSLDDWLDAWSGPGRIFNEYGEVVPPAEMLATITARGDVRHHRRDTTWGPLDIRPGPDGATYDLCNYEFS